ncbi:MAG: hypothetical protein ACRCSR_03490 [Bacteroidales bacterium]
MRLKLPEEYIPIEDKIDDFKLYLKSINRAILSARFGDGKSTFLNEFEEKSKKDYIIFRIYPLNYQVADNKDIFEYIKRDLLLQMLSYDVLEDIDYPTSVLVWNYITNNKLDIVKDLIDSVPDLDLGIVNTDWVKKPFLNLIMNLKNFKEFKEDVQENQKSKRVENFIKALDFYKGSIYEFDEISQLICRINTQIKAKEKKQTILVIEDLDRVDPAHIFRILNILSAHIERSHCGADEWETTKGDNKFLFDKILLVCDIENIKNIFHHFYGERTDFIGYISKFSSHKPFYYSLREGYKDFILRKLSADKDLSRFKTIMSILADLIIEKEIEKNKTESVILRNLDNLLHVDYNLVRQEDIDTGIRTRHLMKNYKVSSLNRVTKLLAIANRFSISYVELDIHLLSNNDGAFLNELYSFIGVCWLIPYSNNPFRFQIENDRFSVGVEYPKNVQTRVSTGEINNVDDDVLKDFIFRDNVNLNSQGETIVAEYKRDFAKAIFSLLSECIIGT